jgi:DNA-binding XRE family transcriptional regulator
MGKIQDLDLFYTALGNRIKNHRISNGYSQDDLAKFLGLTRTSVVNIEKGRQRASLHAVYDLAVFFNIELSDLLISPVDPKKQSDLSRAIKANISTVGKTFKDVPITEEKLSKFFELSSKA